MNLLNPYEFSTLYFLKDTDMLHCGFEIEFDFNDGKECKILGYVATVKGVTDNRFLIIDHVCGGELYVKECWKDTRHKIEDGFIEFAKKHNKKPIFIVDCDRFFESVKDYYNQFERR